MRERNHIIDGLRGLAVVNMSVFHYLFDVYILQGFLPGWRGIPGVQIWQQCICWTFILLSGFCFSLCRRPWKNGLILNGLGLTVTAVTLIAAPEEAIWFGVLNLLGCSLLLTALAQPLLKRIPPWLGLAAAFLLFALTYHVQSGYLSLGDWSLHLPDLLYRCRWLTIFGFPAPGFYSSDYFPILPWWMLYLTGYFAAGLLRGREFPNTRREIPILGWVGRHSLLIYVLHQPAAMVISTLYAMLVRG